MVVTHGGSIVVMHGSSIVVTRGGSMVVMQGGSMVVTLGGGGRGAGGDRQPSTHYTPCASSNARKA